MSKEDVKKLHDLVNAGDAKSDAIMSDMKASWTHMEKIQAEHGLSFTFEEFYDYMHEHTGMTKVEKSDHESHDKTDTCWFCVVSEPPRH